MAATVSAWAKPGAWALDAEEEDASLVMENMNNEIPQTADSTTASDFPSLAAAAAVATGKGSKKKGRKISLAEFSTGHPVSHGTAKFRPSAASFNESIDLVLPTGPREWTAEELERSSRGDRSRWGSSRDDQPRRGGSEGGFGGERDGGPSRADEVDDWGAGKRSVAVGPSRERFSGGGGGGGFFDSQSRADESDSWVSNKRSTPVTMPLLSSNGRRSSDGYRDADNWGRREKDSEVSTGGGRTRLVLQPRSLPLEPTNANSGDGGGDAVFPVKTTKTSTNPFGGARPREEVLQTKPPPPVEEVQSALSVKTKASTNPFGDARPREEVLAEKGHDWKKIDEKLESVKVREAPGFGNRASGLANGSRTDDKTVNSWRKANTAAAIPTSPPSKEKIAEKEEN